MIEDFRSRGNTIPGLRQFGQSALTEFWTFLPAGDFLLRNFRYDIRVRFTIMIETVQQNSLQIGLNPYGEY